MHSGMVVQGITQAIPCKRMLSGMRPVLRLSCCNMFVLNDHVEHACVMLHCAALLAQLTVQPLTRQSVA